MLDPVIFPSYTTVLQEENNGNPNESSIKKGTRSMERNKCLVRATKKKHRAFELGLGGLMRV